MSKFSSWLSALCLGIGIGITGQLIPHIKLDSDKFSEKKHKPISSFEIERQGYSLAYDARNKNPIWVYEHLTAENIKGNTERSRFSFKEDDSLPNHLISTLEDYKKSGFDRGHIAAAANHKISVDAMQDTFYMTNICPQCAQFNRGYWAKLEKHVRDLTKDYKNVHVITGPLYIPYSEDGKRYIKYQVIGKNDVAVPTHFFKVIILEDNFGNIENRSYILPNKEISSNNSLDEFKTTIDNIEKLAGIILKTKLNDIDQIKMSRLQNETN